MAKSVDPDQSAQTVQADFPQYFIAGELIPLFTEDDSF